MSDDAKSKKFRSPPCPAIGLEKAIERARELYAKAQGFQVGFAVLADAWEYGEKSSGLWGTAAALIHYGLLDDEGTGKSRKFKITEAANRILRDPDPDSEKRREAIRRAALKPAIFSELWDKFRDAKALSDPVLITYLALDRADEGKAPFSDSSAAEAIKNYRETISFAGLGDSDTMSLDDGESGRSGKSNAADKGEAKAKIGDFVQWTKNGSDQFKPPRKVEWVSEDGRFLRVKGSPTGIDMNEVTVTDPPAPPPPGVTPALDAQAGKREEDINVYLTGKRLQITADVDAEGLKRLKRVLDKYDDILELLQ